MQNRGFIPDIYRMVDGTFSSIFCVYTYFCCGLYGS